MRLSRNWPAAFSYGCKVRKHARSFRITTTTSRVMPSSSSDLDWSDLQCAPGEQGIGLPHPDLMTPEEKALYYPKRWRPQESGQLEKTPKRGGLRDPR